MNEFTAKKLAEVEAFCKVAGLIVQKAGAGFSGAYSPVASILDELSKRSVAQAISDDQKQVFEAKLGKTTDKLSSMMELYVGDEWDNPVEVLEWSSFFTGAGAAHCALASELDPALKQQLANAGERFQEALQQVILGLQAVGAARKAG